MSVKVDTLCIVSLAMAAAVANRESASERKSRRRRKRERHCTRKLNGRKEREKK